MTTSTDFLTQSMRASLAAIIRDAALKFEKLALLPDSARPNRAMDTVHEMRRRGNYHAFLHSLSAMLRLSESLHVMHGGQCAQSLLQPTVHYQRRMLNQSCTSSANTAATTSSSAICADNMNISEVAVFNRVLTDAELATLYAARAVW